MRQAMKKIKVLGYPFAGGQPRGGVELTPQWLNSQSWFQQLSNSRRIPIEYEEVRVSHQANNSKFDHITDVAEGE